MKEREGLSEQAINSLAELGNIGAGNAITSLSILLDSRLTMTPPQVEIYDFNSLENVVGGSDATVVGVLSQTYGEMESMILFIVGVEDAKNITKTLMGNKTDLQSEMGMSVIKEIANILIGSYVASLETLSGMKIRYSLPEICIDMAGAILSVPCIEFGKISDKALMINSQFKVGKLEINGYIMLISEIHSFDTLLNQLGCGGVNE